MMRTRENHVQPDRFTAALGRAMLDLGVPFISFCVGTAAACLVIASAAGIVLWPF